MSWCWEEKVFSPPTSHWSHVSRRDRTQGSMPSETYPWPDLMEWDNLPHMSRRDRTQGSMPSKTYPWPDLTEWDNLLNCSQARHDGLGGSPPLRGTVPTPPGTRECTNNDNCAQGWVCAATCSGDCGKRLCTACHAIDKVCVPCQLSRCERCKLGIGPSGPRKCAACVGRVCQPCLSGYCAYLGCLREVCSRCAGLRSRCAEHA